MRTWMTSALSLLCVLGAACGGDDNKVPAEKNFTYGAGSSAAIASSTEGTTAQTAVGGLTTALAGGVSDSTAEQFATMANELVDNLVGPVNTPMQPKLQPMINARIAPLAATAATPPCVTVTADKITYACSATQNGNTESMNGYFQKVGNVVSWDITMAYSGSDPNSNSSGTMSFHYFGSLTVTASTIVGHARVDLRISGTMNGQSVNVAASQAVNVDLAYYQSCITSGTVEAKLWWQSTQGASGTTQDKAIKLTFSDGGPTTCAQTVTIARSQ